MRAPALSSQGGAILAKKRRTSAAEQDVVSSSLHDDPVIAIAQVMVFVKIILTVLLLDPRSLDTFTLPKSAAGHATTLFMAALLVWLFARHGRALLVWSPIHAGAGALLLAFALATPFAIDPTIALFGAFRRYLGVTQMLDNVVLYFAVATLFRDLRSLRLLATVSIGVVVPVLAYAFVQREGLDPLTFQQSTTQVPISTLGNPDIAGAFVSITGAAALGLAVGLRGAVTPVRAALVAVGAACVLVLFATGARAGLLGFGAGWLAVLAVTLRMPEGGRRRATIALVGAVLLAAGALASPIRTRLDPQTLGSDVALISRIDIWQAATKAIVERPILGAGPDNFAAVYPARRSEFSIRTGELQNSTHDLWLYVGTSAGLVGIAALLLLVVMTLREGLRLARRGHPGAFALVPFAAYLGESLVNVNDVALDLLFWTSIGVVAASSASVVRTARRASAPYRARLVGLLALAAAVVVALLTTAPRLVAGENQLATEAFTGAGRAAEALAYGRAAIDADPRRAELWSSYGGALTAAQAQPAALMALTVAAERQPWHPLSWKNLAIVSSRLGNRTAARAAAERAVVSDPFDGMAREILATLAYTAGEYPRAAKEGELAIDYQRAVAARDSAYFVTISAYVQRKELARAEALSKEAVALFGTDQLRLQYAAILADEGKTADALAILDQMPNNVDARRLRAAITGK